MKIGLYVIILTALLFVPLQRVEIANLEPIQAVLMHVEGGKIILETDTGSQGRGVSVSEALDDMKHRSPGVVYLDTSQYLFVSNDAIKEINGIRPYLKNSTWICIWDGQGGFENAVKYVDTHKIGLRMNCWEGFGNLPELPVITIENSDNLTS